jgi:hypothetical protein
MNGYITLLRNPIVKENKVLFRMADRILNENDHYNLLQVFSKVEID